MQFEPYTFIHSFIHQWLYKPLLGRGLFFSFVVFFYTDGRTSWTRDQPVAKPLLHAGRHKHRINAHTDIHALSGIRAHDRSVRASKDISCLRSHGHCDRQNLSSHTHTHTHTYIYIHTHIIYTYNVTCRPIARERVDKHVSLDTKWFFSRSIPTYITGVVDQFRAE
jgi:hypothetical protein